jgi:hypothetical protein
MAQTIPRSMPAAMMSRLHALAEQRCAHFAELLMSGRWAYYYYEDEFLTLMAEAQAAANISQSMVHQMELLSASSFVGARQSV